MKTLKQFYRLIYINHVLAKNGLDNLIVSIHLFAPLRFITYLNPWNWFRRKSLSRGEALRKTLVTLGPIFIKFGQALSTRPDLLPADIICELSKLQDNVPPFSSKQALSIIESAYGQPASSLFAQFDETALASASIAQVHAATLKSGEDVVVKILRPGMRDIIKKDIGILKTVARLADRYWPESRRFKPQEIVHNFEQNLLDELNLQREAANASQLKRNFENSPLLYIPTIYWDYVQKNILVMERIYGIPVNDVETLKAHQINMEKLAKNGVEIFFTQVFRDCFFHADMHPGNIFVSYKTPDNPQYLCVDFGIIGTLNENDKRYLAENFIAFFNRDYRRVAQLHIESGWVAKATRAEDFESAIRTVCEPIFERPLKDISLAFLVLELLQVAQRFNMEVQPQLILLQKTLLAIEGLGRQIYPELDLWSTAKPFLEQWLKKELSPKMFLHNLRDNVPFIIEKLPHLPRLLHDVLVLSKTQQEHAMECDKQPISPTTKSQGKLGFGIGVFTTVLALGALHQVTWLNQFHLTSITLLTAAVGGLLIISTLKK